MFSELHQAPESFIAHETFPPLSKLPIKAITDSPFYQEASEFYSSAAVTVRQIQLTRSKAIMRLLEEIRPHALSLVDAWQFPDWQLDSSLGRKDGKVYEDMFYRASELNPLNGLTVDPYPDSDILIKKDETSRYKSKL